MENLHEGHRRRLYAKFLKNGLDGFADHEVLELVLSFAIRRGDTNETAHRLMQEFGSLCDVFAAPYEQLQNVKGVGPHSALLLKVFLASFMRYQADRTRKENDSTRLTTYYEVCRYFAPQFDDETEEVVLCVYLDNAGRIIKGEEICRGGLSQVRLDMHKIARNALLCNARSVAIAHNHPSGTTYASNQDIDLTRELDHILRRLGITLLDHCIVANGKADSICQVMRPIGYRR